MVKTLSDSDATQHIGQAFGQAVALDGNTLATLAVSVFGGYPTQPDTVFVYERNLGSPDNRGEAFAIRNPDDATRWTGDQFGYSVAISGEQIAIGAPMDDEFPISGCCVSEGSVSIYRRDPSNANNWLFVTRLFPTDKTNQKELGHSVAIDRNTVIGGAIGNNAGEAYIFQNSGAGWTQMQKLLPSDPVTRAEFLGNSVAITGDSAVVGAPSHSHASLTSSGAAYLFQRNQGGADKWGQLKEILSSDLAAQDRFGYSAAMSGSDLLIGAYLDTNVNGTSNGSADLFSQNEGGANNWGEVAKFIPGDPNSSYIAQHFGNAVAISPTVTVIGSADDTDPLRLRTLGTTQAGSAYLRGKPPTTLVTSDASGTYGGTTTLSATLTATSDGSPLSGKTIGFSLNGVPVGSAVTASSGVATLPGASLSGITVESYPAGVKASFAGDSGYAPSTDTAQLTVNPAPLTVTGITANNKVYDGTTAATLNTGSAALMGVISGDTVTLNTAGAIGTFSDETVGTGKTVTITGLALGGTDAPNYTLTQPTTTADITPPQTPNQPPAVSISAPAPGSLIPVGTTINLTAPFTDPDTGDIHTCEVNWDDGTPPVGSALTESSGSGTCSDSRQFSVPGVYTFVVTVTDSSDNSGTATVMIVVYDPNGGFVTGGGWIDSPAGAYPANSGLTGKANFGFVSKYKKGATTPTGQTEFQFKVADFNFHSTSYEWLVVSGPRAQYKRSGTVNGADDYGFLLTATDGDINGGGGQDKFRIKVWEKLSGDIVYDNLRGASDDLDLTDPQIIGGGSIVIHTK